MKKVSKRAAFRSCKGFGALVLASLLVFSFPGISAAGGWGKVLSDNELNAVYAQGLRMDWSAGINLFAAGKFHFKFSAHGTVSEKTAGKDFGAAVSLLGGFFNFNFDQDSNNSAEPTVTIPVNVGGIIGEITKFVEVTDAGSGSPNVEINHGAVTDNILIAIQASNVKISTSANVLLAMHGAGLSGLRSPSVTGAIRNALCGCY